LDGTGTQAKILTKIACIYNKLNNQDEFRKFLKKIHRTLQWAMIGKYLKNNIVAK